MMPIIKLFINYCNKGSLHLNLMRMLGLTEPASVNWALAGFGVCSTGVSKTTTCFLGKGVTILTGTLSFHVDFAVCIIFD